MIAKFLSEKEAEKRFKIILARYREAAENEKTNAGNNTFASKNPIKFDEKKNLITVKFLRFNAYYQLLGGAIELWIEAENGIDEENVSRKMTNLFQALKSSTQHFAPDAEPEEKIEKVEKVETKNKEKPKLKLEKQNFTPKRVDPKDWERLNNWLNNNDMTIIKLQHQLGFLPGSIMRQLRRPYYGRGFSGKFAEFWQKYIDGGSHE